MNTSPFFFITAGESHGAGLVVIVEGVPAGIEITEEDIKDSLSERKRGYGRGKRMQIEEDKFLVTGGLRGGKTTGSPFSVLIWNTEREKWKNIMNPFSDVRAEAFVKPRPGHADLAGVIKFGLKDIRDVLERASARETAARVVAGTLAKKFLNYFGIKVLSFVTEIGPVKVKNIPSDYENLLEKIRHSELRTPDKEAEVGMKGIIEKAKKGGDTVGGTFMVRVNNVPPGLGSYSQWYKKLDARIAMALMSIPGIKAVESGAGREYSKNPGSKMHDEIFPLKKKSNNNAEWWEKYKFCERKTNNAGGIEGGVSNGEDIEFKAIMKPIPTLKKPLNTINLKTGKAEQAFYERSDVCVVPSASFIGENMVALTIASAFVEKFGGDSVSDVEKNYLNYLERVKDQCRYF